MTTIELIGVVGGLAETWRAPGLLLLDGHEDTMPLDVVEDGEAANCEVGLLLGLTGRTLRDGLGVPLPALDTDSLCLLGQRDADWRRRFNVGSLADLGVWSRDLTSMRADPGGAARDAARHLRERTNGWWLHVDVDVLDPTVVPAQGLPDYPDEPDGLDLGQLAVAMTAAVAEGGCLGLSMAIYDPDQDPAGDDAAHLVELVGTTVRALA
ncbi:arginase family protein [Georgenia sp. Z1344]|uniref:arginase family protein n=1 Tax=Georgenia sp. Z1344 TaxID=3416706 RepID=UPI003CEA5F53